jgi:hypothetical protein
VVKFGEVAKGQRKIYVTADNGEEKEYSVQRGVQVNVQEGERLKAGEPLMDGPLNPHDILAVLGGQRRDRRTVCPLNLPKLPSSENMASCVAAT